MKENRESLPLINEKIRAPKLQLIGHDGENIGVISRYEALDRAREVGLDLVIIAEEGKEGVPVAKIVDFVKVLYEKKKKKAESKKHQKVIQIKEIKISPKIGDHDYLTKMKQAVDFLQSGKRVKITIFFRGRENVTKDERGKDIFEKVESTFATYGLANNLAHESDSRAGKLWSRIYYLKKI